MFFLVTHCFCCFPARCYLVSRWWFPLEQPARTALHSLSQVLEGRASEAGALGPWCSALRGGVGWDGLPFSHFPGHGHRLGAVLYPVPIYLHLGRRPGVALGRCFPPQGIQLLAGEAWGVTSWRSWVSREEISCPSLCPWYGFCPWSRLWLLLNSTASQYAMHFCGTVVFM